MLDPLRPEEPAEILEPLGDHEENGLTEIANAIPLDKAWVPIFPSAFLNAVTEDKTMQACTQ